MKFVCENGVLTIYLEGRVDTTNAAAVGDEIDGICASNTYKDLVLDIDELKYISSVGLRLVLKLRKKNATMRVINASAEVYDIFDMTGFTEMITIEKAFRKLSIDGCTAIGRGAKGIVYRYNDDTIIKVYKNNDSLPIIQRERELARKAFVLGIPTAISYDVVKVGDKFGSVFELLDAKSYSRLIVDDPANRDKYISEYAELLRLIHSTTVKADDMPDIKVLVRKWIKDDAEFLDKSEIDRLNSLVDAVPDTLNMLHCDYHTNNVMMQGKETLLIDMDSLSHGHPIFELANIYITYVGFGEVDPTIVENFIGLPYAIATEIWDKFIPVYLGTKDQNRIDEVMQKVKLLSYVRFLRHTARRGLDDPNAKKTVDICKNSIRDLLTKVDTLTF